MSRAILWFRNDLRLADNAALTATLADHDEVLPIVIVDPRQHGASPFGFARSGEFRRRFLHESHAALDRELRAKGGSLRVCWGEPAHVLRELSGTWDASAIYAQQLHAWEEQQQERDVSAVRDLRLSAPNTLLHPEDLTCPVEDLPHVFTTFRKAVEAHSAIRSPLPEPEHIPTPPEWAPTFEPCRGIQVIPRPWDARSPFVIRGGRAEGLARLHHYLWGSHALSKYKGTRNGSLRRDDSSRLSPWLASGALSAQEIHHAVKRYEAEHGANESTYWLIFELLWRDFFQLTAAKHGAHFFKRQGLLHRNPVGDQDLERFKAWCEGRTGQPFIDAHMRELACTGWMSNRGRQNVASYLVHDLGIDWRMGAYWFERQLIDYDPCSNWGNWLYLAGVGNDPRAGRRFYPVRQAAMYDADGAYVRLWDQLEQDA